MITGRSGLSGSTSVGDETIDENLSDELIRGTDGAVEPLDPSRVPVENSLLSADCYRVPGCKQPRSMVLFRTWQGESHFLGPQDENVLTDEDFQNAKFRATRILKA